MWPSERLSSSKLLYIARQPTAPRACTSASVWTWGMVIVLVVTILSWQARAETTTPALSPTLEPTPAALRRGIVTIISNLRASPSMHSEIVAVAKEGTRVMIVLESGRWLQVRSEEGVEAWIYKPLVLIEQEPRHSSSAAPGAVAASDSAETGSAVSTTPDVLVESPAENTLEGPGPDVSSAPPIVELHIPPQVTWTTWVSDTWLSHLQGRGAYVIITLIMILMLSIALQVRAARHLRRARWEVGQILDLLEEIYAGGALARTSDSGAMRQPMTAEALAQQPLLQGIEFSSTECTVLQALSDQPEVQETELGKILDEKGFKGVLIKAIIGNIVRKTGVMGLPWVEVRYVQGGYRYRLHSQATPNFNMQRLVSR